MSLFYVNFNFVYSGLKNEIAEIVFDVFRYLGGIVEEKGC